MDKIKILDKEFRVSLSSSTIQQAVARVASQINADFSGEEVLFISILNGSFMFTADLLKQINLPARISFVKVSSYAGAATSGNVKELIGLNEDISGKNVVIIEDIIDTGITIENIVKQLKAKNPAKLKVASLLFKPEAYLKEMKIDYVGLEIPNLFIVGYGLDYDGYGRNFEDIYVVD